MLSRAGSTSRAACMCPAGMEFDKDANTCLVCPSGTFKVQSALDCNDASCPDVCTACYRCVSLVLSCAIGFPGHFHACLS
jgi:hypothetical protein